MSLFDRDDPRHLAYLERWKKVAEKVWPDFNRKKKEKDKHHDPRTL